MPAAPAAPAAPVPWLPCDCHMHLYDARYPAVAGARFTPPDAWVPAYRRLQRQLGLRRCVVVTPSTYGLDNRCTVDALQALRQAGTPARGIAVLDTRRADEATLAALHAAGVRGVRFNQTLGGTTLDDLEPLAERIAPLGWHVELLLPAALWPGIGARLQALPVPVVLDHFGRLPYQAHRHAGHRTLLALLENDRTWVKLSGPYLTGVARADWQADAQAMAGALVRAAPHRLVWGSNWPHPSVTAGLHAAPDDAELLALLARWAGDDATHRRILVDNPTDLYDFDFQEPA